MRPLKIELVNSRLDATLRGSSTHSTVFRQYLHETIVNPLTT